MTGAGTWCAVKTLQCSTYRSHWVARVPRRILRRTLRNSFLGQLNGSGNVVISVGHLRVSHVFSLFDLFSSDILLTLSLFSVHPLIHIWVVSLFLAVMNNAVTNICVQVIVRICVLFYFFLGVEHI